MEGNGANSQPVCHCDSMSLTLAKWWSLLVLQLLSSSRQIVNVPDNLQRHDKYNSLFYHLLSVARAPVLLVIFLVLQYCKVGGSPSSQGYPLVVQCPIQAPLLREICGTLYLSRPGVTLCHPSLIFTTALLPLSIFVFFSISFQNLSSVRIESVFGLGQWYIPIIKGRDSAFFFFFPL